MATEDTDNTKTDPPVDTSDSQPSVPAGGGQDDDRSEPVFKPGNPEALEGGQTASITIEGKKRLPPAQGWQKRLQNPLGDFSSYTYQITLYMITPDAYDAFIMSGRKNINIFKSAEGNVGKSGSYIIAQSGGINRDTHNRAFDLDVYIDNLKIKQSTNAKENGTATNVTEMSFNIIEPYGFSFVRKLTDASKILKESSGLQEYKAAVGSGKINSMRQFFVLSVRFQGYDQYGALITTKESGSDGAFERFYDIYLTEVKFKIDGKTTIYSIKAATIPPGVSFGAKYGRVDINAEVTAETVREALEGGSNGVKGIGLLTILNNQQQDQVNKPPNERKIANVYKLKFMPGAESIANAKVVTDTDKRNWPMSPSRTTNDVNDVTNIKIKPDSTMRQITFRTDTSIMQAISNIIRQSTYLSDALKLIRNSEITPQSDDGDKILPEDAITINWYNLSSEVKVIDWDSTIGSFAYEITYIIRPYQTPFVMSSLADRTVPYYGPHKRYNYVWTGKNSEVISYEQTLNNQFYNAETVPSSSSTSHGFGAGVPTVPGKRTEQDRTGKLDKGMEAQNSYVNFLYSPGEWARSKIQILGDPDFLIQDSPGSVNDVYNQYYGTDGFTINPNGGQVFVEINFNEGIDYNNDTGTLDINRNLIFWNYPQSVKDKIERVSYMVVTVTSTFDKGKFIQDLDSVINTNISDTKTKSESDAGRYTDESERMKTRGSYGVIGEYTDESVRLKTRGDALPDVKKTAEEVDVPTVVYQTPGTPANSPTANDDASDIVKKITSYHSEWASSDNARAEYNSLSLNTLVRNLTDDTA